MKPSETVLLGAGWSEGDLYYEAYSLEGGFFELRWWDALNHKSLHDKWFPNHSDIMAVYNAVVVKETSTAQYREKKPARLPHVPRGPAPIEVIDSMRNGSDPYAALNCKECLGVFDRHTIRCEHPPQKIRDPLDCGECWGSVCTIHQQEVVFNVRRVESMIDKVKEQIAVKKVAQQEYKDALERSKVLTVELIDLLEGVTGADSVLFTASFDGRRSHQVDKPEEEREERTYRVYRCRSTSKTPWRLTIECRMPSGSWSANSVVGMHRLELLEYLLGHETKIISRDEIPQMPW